MKNYSLVIFSLLLFLIPFNSFSQQNESNQYNLSGNLSSTGDINPLRVGLKVGVPSVFTMNLEYVTPLLDNRVAFAIDYFSLNVNASDVEAKFKNFEIGSNIYLKNTGKGLYGGLSYFKFDAET